MAPPSLSTQRQHSAHSMLRLCYTQPAERLNASKRSTHAPRRLLLCCCHSVCPLCLLAAFPSRLALRPLPSYTHTSCCYDILPLVLTSITPITPASSTRFPRHSQPAAYPSASLHLTRTFHLPLVKHRSCGRHSRVSAPMTAAPESQGCVCRMSEELRAGSTDARRMVWSESKSEAARTSTAPQAKLAEASSLGPCLEVPRREAQRLDGTSCCFAAFIAVDRKAVCICGHSAWEEGQEATLTALRVPPAASSVRVSQERGPSRLVRLFLAKRTHRHSLQSAVTWHSREHQDRDRRSTASSREGVSWPSAAIEHPQIADHLIPAACLANASLSAAWA